MTQSSNIFDWIKSEENGFQTRKIQIGDNWYWSFRDHVQMIFHLKNSIFFTGDNNWLRSFKNVMQPILQLSYWTEDIDVKDVTFFIEGQNGKVLSFLVKKYHDEVYIRENDLDMLFDEITESDVDYGGVLVQRGAKIPEVIPLNSIAFCDQTDILGSPIAFKFDFSPSKLSEMSKYGWGDERNGATISIQDLIVLATNEKSADSLSNNKNILPGKNIEIYVVKGSMPNHYLDDSGDMEKYKYQIQIVGFYLDKDNKRQGVVLYRKEDDDDNLEFFTSKKVYKRALGSGVGEQLLHPQIWTNFLTIHKTNMLEAASKVPLYTDDENYTSKNKIQDMETLEVTTIAEGKRINQVPTAAPANIQLFSNEINMWYEQAQSSGSAYDPILGKEESSGTTFRGQERLVAQGRGTHDKRRGQRAKFIEKIYRNMILPDIKREILKGKKFLASLTNDELNWVAERMATVQAEQIVVDAILKDGKYVTEQEKQALIEIRKTSIMKQGNRHLVEILKGEFEDIDIKIGINVAGKQKDLVNLSDKLLSIFQFIFANPQAFQSAMKVPALSKAFENILEFGGLSIGDFSTMMNQNSMAQQGSISNTQQQPQLLTNNQSNG